MRLIHVSKLELRDFGERERSPYAILLHTWGKDEVILPQCASAVRSELGHRAKIKNCCDLALSEGHQYLWVDICCIDKSSSAELSETIISMFKWYRDTRICYVYLEDVNLLATAEEAIDSSKHDASMNSDGKKFEKSRWFTRGWTLQELLAPQIFDSCDCRLTRIAGQCSRSSFFYK